MEILEEWITGRGKRPVTWSTLIEVLHDIELSTLARELAAVKLLAQDRPTEDTEDSTVSDVVLNTLTEVLHNIELSTLAREIEAVKLKLPTEDAEDRPTEDSTDSDISLNTLTEVLHSIELSTSAREIEAVKLPVGDGEDGRTEDTEDSNPRTVSRVPEDSGIPDHS